MGAIALHFAAVKAAFWGAWLLVRGPLLPAIPIRAANAIRQGEGIESGCLDVASLRSRQASPPDVNPGSRPEPNNRLVRSAKGDKV